MIKRSDIEQMAKLAKIDLDEKEIESLQGGLSDIIEYINKMKGLDLSGVQLLAHSIVGENITRDDIDINYDDRENLIDNFTERDGAYLKVRPIL